MAQKKRSKSNFFIIAEIIVCWIQSMDQSSTYLLSKRGPKDISITFRIFEKQTRMWYMVEIAVNRLLKSSCFMFSCWPAPNNHEDWYNYEIISVNSSAWLFHTPPKSRTKDSFDKIRFRKDFLQRGKCWDNWHPKLTQQICSVILKNTNCDIFAPDKTVL